MVEPKNVKQALLEDDWIIAMQEELNQFERNQVWELVEPPQNQGIIRIKWVFEKGKWYDWSLWFGKKACLVPVVKKQHV